jgi:uncharacterized membrane protein YdjX (TVP38/TMEM64 family)
VIEALIRIVGTLQGRVWAAPAFMAVYVLGCLLFPITPFPVAGGILFGFWPGVLYNWAGSTLGSSLAFWIARKGAREWIMKRLGRRPIPPFLRRPDFTVMLVARLVGFPPFTLINYMAGLSEAPFGTYLAATAAGMLPWTVIMSFFSNFLWKALLEGGMAGLKHELYHQAGPLLLTLVLFGALVGLSAFLGRRYLGSGTGNSKE